MIVGAGYIVPAPIGILLCIRKNVHILKLQNPLKDVIDGH